MNAFGTYENKVAGFVMYQCSRSAVRAQAMWETTFVRLVVAVGKFQQVKLNKDIES